MAILTPTEELKRVLVSRTDGLGDLIATLPVATALKALLPEVEVAFMVNQYTAPIARRIAEIDRVVTVSSMRRALHVIRIYHPDAIIFARPELKLAIDALLARVDVRIGTGYRWYSGLFTRWVYDHRRKGARHESEYSVNLLSPLFEGELPVRMPTLIVSPSGAAEASRRLAECGISGQYMVIHPGCRGSAGAYSPSGYAQVARAMLDQHEDLQIAITAGPGEIGLSQEIRNRIGDSPRVFVVDEMTLDGFSELLRGAQGFLGSSSGPAHLAALVRIPVVGLYPGLPPLWPARWRPWGDHVTTLVPHPEEPFCHSCDRGHQPENCVGRIAVGRVIEACNRMLQGADIGLADHIV